MYVHIGGEACIPDSEIIGILDMDLATEGSNATHRYLVRMEEEGRIEAVLPEIPRSIVLTRDKVFLTPLSVHVLEQRILSGMKMNHNGD